MEQTLALIKPDAFDQHCIGEVIRRIEAEGYAISGMKMTRLTREQAAAFYAEHDGKPFFETLVDFMTSGPLVALVLKGENVIPGWRNMMGATNFKEAKEGTIRRDFATAIERNVVHGSDAPESAAREIPFFFSRKELIH